MKRTYPLLRSLCVLLLLVFVPLEGIAQSAFKDHYTKSEFMVPMRDGTSLYTAIYVPKNQPGKHPILLERTPYGAGPYGPELYRAPHGSPQFQENGYIFATQDVRGMGHSQGTLGYDNDSFIFGPQGFWSHTHRS